MDADVHGAPGVDRERILKAAVSLGILDTRTHSAPRLLAALCNPAASGEEVARLIRSEPALYAKVLRVANSPFYGQTRRIQTIDRALVLLGTNAVCSIAAAACLNRSVAREQRYALVDMHAVVEHSLATAVAADMLARIHHPELAPEAFIAGLLHNLGVAVQVDLNPSGVKTLIERRQRQDGLETRASEAACGLIGHETCAAIVFETWGLPERLIAATAAHHEPINSPEPHRALTALINLGATLGLETGNCFALEPVPGVRDERAMALLELDADDLNRVAATLPARILDLKSALLGG
jgi:HD-like signal output (HDOD) protein